MPRRARRAPRRGPPVLDDPLAGLNFHDILPPAPPIDMHSPFIESSSSSDSDDSASVIAEDDEPGMVAECRQLYRQHSSRRWRTRVPVHSRKLKNCNDKNAKFAVVARREKDVTSDTGLRLHSIKIQSPLLRSFVDDVFDGFGGVKTKLKDCSFDAPFQEFVHRWDRYEKLMREATEATQLRHIELLNDVLEPEILPLVLRKREMVEQNLAAFHLLWSLFEPKCEVFTEINGQERVFQLLSTECIDYDGASGFGYAPYQLEIHHFDGYQPITDLRVIPLNLHPDRAGLEERLTARGKRFEQLKGFHYKSYSGNAMPSDFRSRTVKVDNRRVVIDADMYYSRAELLGNPCPRPLLEPLHACGRGKKGKKAKNAGAYTVRDLDSKIPSISIQGCQKPTNEEKCEIEEHQYRLCTSELKGYDLKTKAWIKMEVDGIGDINFNSATFERLILPNDNKHLILSLIQGHLDPEQAKFDDIVQGKGKGMVVLLSGEPGIGKTLTAEAVAEQMEKPLFSMSAGQLGPTLENVEDDLDDILEICAKWGAVLLIDEADVFLEKRQLTDIHRNKLVSVFLRLLEYYEGCMFLTTNRGTILDPAIRSRIDLHVDYGKLDMNAKRHIWKTFVKPSKDFPTNTSAITDEELDVLAKLDINGREIKNLVKTGRLLARKKDEELAMGHLKTVLSVQTGVPMI